MNNENTLINMRFVYFYNWKSLKEKKLCNDEAEKFLIKDIEMKNIMENQTTNG